MRKFICIYFFSNRCYINFFLVMIFSYNYDYERKDHLKKDEMIIGNYLLYFGFLLSPD